MKKCLKWVMVTWLFLLGFVTLVPLPAHASNSVQLSDSERLFIQEHPVIHVGVDPSFVPYEFIDIDGTYNGIAKEYLDLISLNTGLVFEIVPNLTWDKAYEKAVLKEIDLLPIISKSEERERYFLFSEPYYYFQRVIFIGNDVSDIASLDDLEGRSVAVQRNSSHHEFLKTLPNISMSLYDTVEDAISALASGSEQAFIGNLATTLYLAKQGGISQLAYITIKDQNRQTLHFAVRNDYPELLGIMNKGLSAITQAEKIAIDNRWIGVVSRTDYTWLFQLALAIGGIALIIVSVSTYWIKRLQKEIKQRKVVETQLKFAKDDAERANQVKSSFLARMSHEIRTPLHAVTGMAYILKNSGLNKAQQSYLNKISSASKDVLEIINDILDFSKIESGKVELERTNFNLDEILERLVSILSFKVQEQGIEFIVERDVDVPVYYYGDAKRIQQILLNLLNNAVKFTESGWVKLQINLVKEEKSQATIKLIIEDTGIGMTEEQVEHLFEPFMQADASINRRFGGTGLGLSIVKNLLDIMGGTIIVKSESGKGTTFEIDLMLELDRDRMDEQNTLIQTLNLSRIKALILDNSSAHSSILKATLSSFKITSEIVLNEDELYRKLQSDPFDLLLVDYDTPANNGLVFARELGLLKDIVLPKIILVFPSNVEGILEQLNNYGVALGIPKPIIPSVLFNGIIDLFQSDMLTSLETQSNNVTNMNASIEVLLCEDNKTNQFIAKTLLDQAGYHVEIAENGQVGVDLIRKYPTRFDVVLMDIHMPILNGYDATRVIHDINPDLLIVAMTADAIMGVEEKCKEVGIHHFISKPFDPSKLAKTIHDLVLDRHGYIPSSNQNVDAISTDETLVESLGLANTGGNKELYKVLLDIFLQENEHTLEELNKSIAKSDWELAVGIVHKIKGSCGTIGAKALNQVCVDLQNALNQNDSRKIDELHMEFELQFSKLISLIKTK